MRWAVVAALSGLAIAVVALWFRLHGRGLVVPQPATARQSAQQDTAGERGLTTTPEQAEIAALIAEATQQAERLVGRFPKRAAAYHALAVSHYELGRNAEAERWWRHALELEQRTGDAYRWLAYVAMDRGDYAQAAELYRKLLTVAPSSADGRFGLAEACVGLGDLQTARGLLQRDAIPDRIESAPAFLLLGQIWLELGDYRKAREHYLQAARLMPRAPPPCYGLAMACAKLGEAEQAAEWRRKFAALGEAERQTQGELKGVRADLFEVRGKLVRILTAVGEAYAACGDQQEAARLQLRAAEIEQARREEERRHAKP